MERIVLLSTAVLFFSTISTAQDVLWEKSYGGIHSEYLFDAVPTADYGFILAGSSLSGKSGDKDTETMGDLDYWIWKMDENGDLDWQRRYGGSGADYLNSIRCTADGGYILAGTSDSPKGGDKREEGSGQEDIWVIKLNAEGGEQWQKTLGGSGRDVLKTVRPTGDGGYIIGGSTESRVSGSKTALHYGSLDYWVVKLDAGGAVEWQKSYGGRYTDQLESIEPTRDGGYIIGGRSNSPLSGNKAQDAYGEGDFWLLKLNGSGEIEWQRTLGGEGDDHLSILIESMDGGFYAGGSSRSGIYGVKDVANGKGSDFWLIKLSEIGEIVWQETYDFGENDRLASMVADADGSLLIGGHAKTETTGLSRSDSEGIDDFIALKITDKGEELWRRTVGSTEEDNLRTLVETRDGGYLLVGTSHGKASRDKNTGKGLADFWAVKLRDGEKEEKERFVGLEAFPNPAGAHTTIVVNHEFEQGTLRLYDLNGRQVLSFPVQHRLVPVNLQGLSTGVYIITVGTDVATESVKILKK